MQGRHSRPSVMLCAAAPWVPRYVSCPARLGARLLSPERHHCVSSVEVERPPDLPHHGLPQSARTHNQCASLVFPRRQ